ncbi:MAG: NAD-dependent epimerase/dehydratase family protein [Longimicrobiaceae bacterium]
MKGNKRVLVTGGAGFIGSHVADAYLAAGYQVTVLDDLSRGRREWVPAGAGFHQLDVRDPQAAELIGGSGFDIINHHAAQIDVRLSVADPRFDASVNLDGLLNLLESARESGVKRFIYVSSGGVIYGEPEIRPTPETSRKLPESPYGVTKLAGEYYLYYYRRVHGLEYVSLRYANVYGPRQDPHGEAGVVAIFSNRLLSGERLAVFGDGEQTRDYVHVADVVTANLLCSEVRLDPPRSIDDRGFNVGTGRETSVNELARVLMQVSGRSADVEQRPARPGELRRSSLDAGRLGALGWSPRITLEEGLRETYAYLAGGGITTMEALV